MSYINRTMSHMIDYATLKISCSTIWDGNLYTVNTKADFSEPLQTGNIYIFTMIGLSGTYLMEFPCTYRGDSFQCAYYDGTNYCRWRINFSDKDQYNRPTKFYLDSSSTNMAANTAIIRVAKVGLNPIN